MHIYRGIIEYREMAKFRRFNIINGDDALSFTSVREIFRAFSGWLIWMIWIDNAHCAKFRSGRLRRMRQSIANYVGNNSGQYFRKISDLRAVSEHRFLTSAALLCTMSVPRCPCRTTTLILYANDSRAQDTFVYIRSRFLWDVCVARPDRCTWRSHASRCKCIAPEDLQERDNHRINCTK